MNYAFDGNEVFKENEKALVFLDKYTGPVADDAYVVLGVYQGKYVFTDDSTLLAPKEAQGDLAKVKSIEDLGISRLTRQ